MVNVAFAGCVHGELNNIYIELAHVERTTGLSADILLCCGDFQAVRDRSDLDSLVCPDRYKVAGDFPDYYHGRRVAPVLTVLIGGNHEASRHMLENYYGGWLAPNIYFMGFAGVLSFRGLRLGGLSGIYKQQSFHAPLSTTPLYPPLCCHATVPVGGRGGAAAAPSAASAPAVGGEGGADGGVPSAAPAACCRCSFPAR